jgi:hypothetical protein
MHASSEHLESNISRLIQVGYGAESRPDPAMHSVMLRSLEIDLHGQQRIAALPEWIVAALVGFLVFLAAWLVLANPQVAVPTEFNTLYFTAAFVLILNIVFLPIASIIIVIRRRYV